MKTWFWFCEISRCYLDFLFSFSSLIAFTIVGCYFQMAGISQLSIGSIRKCWVLNIVWKNIPISKCYMKVENFKERNKVGNRYIELFCLISGVWNISNFSKWTLIFELLRFVLEECLHSMLLLLQTVRVLRCQWAYSCEKARRELGYNPRSLEEGLTEMLSWLKSLKKIKYWVCYQ